MKTLRPMSLFALCKTKVVLVLLFYGSISDKWTKRLVEFFADTYSEVEVKLIFRTTCKLADLFKLKDIIPSRFKSHLVYGGHYTGCSSFYVGMTKRHVKNRFKEHLVIPKHSLLLPNMNRYHTFLL